MKDDSDTIQVELLKNNGFTKRENDVIKLFCTGKSDRQIANSLLISTSTVQSHINHIYRQLGITNAATNKRLSAFISLSADEIIKITRVQAQHETH